ncbi:UvrD-helicase domain-containing protein [Candidatus Saccharibacteria bacterium]|nr:UvrD-helicase domain-containing protein [Candidatus Saccharibacteria bacterium]
MPSEIVKCVAGAGKTTYSLKFLSTHKNGLYLAFTNSVVNEISDKGFLSKTIDSLFSSYIIPKFIRQIPITKGIKNIEYINSGNLPKFLIGITQLHILPKTGQIYNRQTPTAFSLYDEHCTILNDKSKKSNLNFVKCIFNENSLRLTDSLRSELSTFIVNAFPDQLLQLLKLRFDYIIIDEAQDLNGYKEIFIELLEKSDIPIVILGDDNQNIINNSGQWFKNKTATRVETTSKRCPEPICKWIRDELGIEIYGRRDLSGQYHKIPSSRVLEYNDGLRYLLFHAKQGKTITAIIDQWKGPINTIKTAKGSTINQDIVIIGNSMSKKSLYAAITRTNKNAYSTIVKII